MAALLGTKPDRLDAYKVDKIGLYGIKELVKIGLTKVENITSLARG